MNNNQKITTEEIENALSTIMNGGNEILKDSENDVKFGWYDLIVGDFIYFKTYDDINDNVTVSNGEIVEIITSEKKVTDRPNENLESNNWHIERFVSYKIRWNGMSAIIDSRYVYRNKLCATVAVIHDTIKNYFDAADNLMNKK